MLNKVKNLPKKYLIIGMISMIGLIIVIVGSSFAITSFSSGEQNFSSGNLDIDFLESENFTLGNAAPITNEKGMEGPSYTFTVTNTGNVNANYIVKIEEENVPTKADNHYIMITYMKNDDDYIVPVSVSSLSNLTLDTGYLRPNEKVTYKVLMWVSYDAPNELMGKTYNTKFTVESSSVLNIVTIDNEKPIINLNGDYSYNIGLGDTFVDPLGEVVDNVDTISFNDVRITYEYYDGININTVQSIDTNRKGVYYIFYEISDLSGNRNIACRVVNVNPVHFTITLNGSNVTYANTLTDFVDPGAVSYNTANQDVTQEIFTVLGLHTNIGNDDYFFIKYVIKNGDNYNSVVRKVVVTDGYYLKDIIHNDMSKYGSVVDDVITGTNPNNYLKLNDMMYRIVKITDNYVSVVSDEKVDSLVVSDKTFINSNVFTYLNEEFINNINKNYLYSETISLLTKEMYTDTYSTVSKRIGYLNNGTNWLILDTYLSVVGEDGNISALTNETVDIRPMISLKSDLIVSGKGTKTNPYIIN